MELLNEMFKTYQHSACRIETLPIYKIIGDEWDRYQSFTNGQPCEKYNSSGWADMLRNYKAIDKTVERIRIVPKELNSYLIFEFEACYVQNIVAGEKINVIDSTEYNKLVTPETSGDYWIFDNKEVLYMEYDKDGTFLKSCLIEDEKTKNSCINFYNILKQKTYPTNEILKKIRNNIVTLN